MKSTVSILVRYHGWARDLDEITYALIVYRRFRRRWVRNPLKNKLRREPRRKRKIDEAQYASHLKWHLLPPAGAALEQYYLPILETETIFRYLLASMIRVENNIYFLLNQSLLNIGFPIIVTSLDRLIAVVRFHEEEAGITIQLHAPLEAEQFFRMLSQTLEKKKRGRGSASARLLDQTAKLSSEAAHEKRTKTRCSSSCHGRHGPG